MGAWEMRAGRTVGQSVGMLAGVGMLLWLLLASGDVRFGTGSGMGAGVWAQSAPTSPAGESTMPVAEYRALLDDVLAAVQAGDLTPGDYARRLRPLEQVSAVILANGDRVAPASLLSPGGAEEDSPPLEPAQLVARLTLLRNQLAAATDNNAPDSTADNTAARLAVLEEVLARPVFTEQTSLLDRVRLWIEELFRAWFPDWQMPTGPGVPPQLATLVGWLVIGGGALALILLASYWLQGLLANFMGGGAVAAGGTASDLPASAAQARQQAQAAADAGDYRHAVRALYLAALLLLEEHHLLRFDRSHTNREVLARVPADSPIRPHLQPVVETFDAVWYGIRVPDEPTYARYAAEIDALGQVARRTAELAVNVDVATADKHKDKHKDKDTPAP